MRHSSEIAVIKYLFWFPSLGTIRSRVNDETIERQTVW